MNKVPLYRALKFDDGTYIEFGEDGLCKCNCGTKCPIGKMGMDIRCTPEEIRDKLNPPHTRAYRAVPVTGPCGGTYADGYEEIAMGVHEENQEHMIHEDDETSQQHPFDALRERASKAMVEDAERKILGEPSPPTREELLEDNKTLLSMYEASNVALAKLQREISKLKTNGQPSPEHTGNKYIRQCQDRIHPEKWFFVDVYCIIHAFDVKVAGVQHALKKLLCAGLRGKGGEIQDMIEARDALSRAIEMRTAEILKEAEESKT